MAFNIQSFTDKLRGRFNISKPAPPAPQDINIPPIPIDFSTGGGVTTPQTTDIGTGDVLKAFGRGVARGFGASGSAIAGLPKQIKETVDPRLGPGQPGVLKPTGKFQQAIFGQEPISLATEARDITFGKLPEKSPFAPIIGGFVGLLDLTGVGGFRKLTSLLKLSKESADLISVTKNQDEIFNLLKKDVPNIPDDLNTAISKALVDVNDTPTVQRVINEANFAINKAKKVEEVSTKPQTLSQRLTEKLDPERELKKASELQEEIAQAKLFGRTLKEDKDIKARAEIRKEEAPISKALEPLAQEARKFKTAEEFIKEISNISGVSKEARIQVISINKIIGADETELNKAIESGKKLTAKEANEIVGRLEDPIVKGRQISAPISVGVLPNGTFSLLGGNNRVAQALVNGQTEIIAMSNDFKTGFQLTDIFNKAKGEVVERVPEAPVPLKQVTKELKETAPQIPPKKDLKKSETGIPMEGRKDVLKVPLAKISEEESLEILGRQQNESEFALDTSIKEQEQIDSSLDSIFADMKGVKIEDLRTSFTEEDLFQAQFNYQKATQHILDNPARELSKFANKKTGELPEVTGENTSEFARRGDDIVTEKGFADSEEARAAYNIYTEEKKGVNEIGDNFREIAKKIRLQKQRNQFVDASKRLLAKDVIKNVKALQNLVDSATRSGFKKGLSIGNEKLNSMINRLKTRRSKINAIKKVYNLTDSEMKKIRGDADPRFMDSDVFNTYLSELEDKAIFEQKKLEERTIIQAIIKERDLQKTDNLRNALELPPLKRMTLDQLFEFDAALSQSKFGDTFLGSRMIQTVINTDIGPVKTVREIRESLAKQTGVDVRELEGVVGNWGDKFNYDPALAQKNPLYKYMVTEWTAKKIQTEQHVLSIKKKLDTLASASRKSKKRTLGEKLIPQDREVIEWLEARPAEKNFVQKAMTGQQIQYAEYLESIYKHYYEFAKNEAVTRKTLYGIKFSRFAGVYFPHTPITFLERWKDDGFVTAIKNYWENLVEQSIDFSAIGPTGEILGYEKFLKFAIKREGVGGFTKNAARATLNYIGAFEKKLAL